MRFSSVVQDWGYSYNKAVSLEQILQHHTGLRPKDERTGVRQACQHHYH